MALRQRPALLARNPARVGRDRLRVIIVDALDIHKTRPNATARPRDVLLPASMALAARALGLD